MLVTLVFVIRVGRGGVGLAVGRGAPHSTGLGGSWALRGKGAVKRGRCMRMECVRMAGTTPNGGLVRWVVGPSSSHLPCAIRRPPARPWVPRRRANARALPDLRCYPLHGCRRRGCPLVHDLAQGSRGAASQGTNKDAHGRRATGPSGLPGARNTACMLKPTKLRRLGRLLACLATGGRSEQRRPGR